MRCPKCGATKSSVIDSRQAEDGIRDRSVSRGLGDVYKRQAKMGHGGNEVFQFFF